MNVGKKCSFVKGDYIITSFKKNKTMKKIFCSTLILIALVFTSCSRCKTCTSASTLIPLNVELCRDDFDSGKEYRDAIKDLEDNMWECK